MYIRFYSMTPDMEWTWHDATEHTGCSLVHNIPVLLPKSHIFSDGFIHSESMV
jgi:hypothetical protein